MLSDVQSIDNFWDNCIVALRCICISKGAKVTFFKSVETCLRKYADFSGTAPRSEFWWFQLFQILLNAVAGIIDASVVQPVVGLLMILPCLAVGARRLRDVGRSPWWLLLSITLIGILVLLYWWVQPGREDQEYISEYHE